MGCVGKPFFRILKNITRNVRYSVFIKKKSLIQGSSTHLHFRNICYFKPVYSCCWNPLFFTADIFHAHWSCVSASALVFFGCSNDRIANISVYLLYLEPSASVIFYDVKSYFISFSDFIFFSSSFRAMLCVQGLTLVWKKIETCKKQCQ